MIKGVTKTKGKRFAVAIFAVVIAVIIAAVSVFVYPEIANKNKTALPFVYYTENELYACKSLTKNTKSYLICSNFAGKYKFIKGGEYILYTTNEKDGAYDVSLKKVFDKKDTGSVLSKGATSFRYIKGETPSVCVEKDGNIYLADSLGNSTLLQENSKIITSDFENEILLTQNRDNEKLLSLVDVKDKKIQELSDKTDEYVYEPSLSAVYFTDGESLYFAKPGGGNKTIEKNKNAFNLVFSDGKLYYMTSDESFSANDFVFDNCEKQDVEMKEPDWDDYLPNDSDYVVKKYDSYWKTYYSEIDAEAFDKDYRLAEKKFNKALNRYHEAKRRVALRKELKKSRKFITSYALYCYNTRRQKVADNVTALSGITDLSGKSFVRVNATTYKTALSKFKKIDIKKIKTPEDVEKYVKTNLEYSTNTVTNSKITRLFDQKNGEAININAFDESEKSYLITIGDNDDRLTLYSVSEGKALKDKKELSKDFGKLSVIENKYALYSGYNPENEGYTLSFDNEVISDVYGSVLTDEKKDEAETTVFCFAANHNKESNQSSIYKYSDGEIKKLCENVNFKNNMFGRINDRYVYIKADTNELVWYDGEETHLIAENAEGFNNTELKQVRNSSAF